MHEDAHPPTEFQPDEWVRVRDRLFRCARDDRLVPCATPADRDRRTRAAREIAKCMNVIQEDYATRLTTVGIKGRWVAEWFSKGATGFVGLQLPKQGRHDATLAVHIAEMKTRGLVGAPVIARLRDLQKGNDIAHVPPTFLPSHKPRTAHAAYAIAMEVERQLFGATAGAAPAAAGGGPARAPQAARAAGGGPRGAAPAPAPAAPPAAAPAAPAAPQAAGGGAAPALDVAAMLRELGLYDAVYPILESEELTDLDDLRELSKSDLREIGLTMGQAVKILRRIGG